MKNNIELYIHILESRIAYRKEELKKVEKKDFIKRGVMEGEILGYESALRTFLKIFNFKR